MKDDILNKLIISEDTDSRYNQWSSYRNKLTDYIIESVENYYIKEVLVKNKMLRIDKSFNIEEAIGQQGFKPTLAIWGAGGCNDIDVSRLSKYFQLVLIDRDMLTMKKAIERFKLNESSCVCADLHFFDINMKDYSMFEAMLMDNMPIEDIKLFIKELGDRRVIIKQEALPVFDFSVDIGLSSQMVSRLVAIAMLYGRYDEIKESLIKLGQLGIECLEKSITGLTRKMLIHGYELDTDEAMEGIMDRYDIAAINQEIKLDDGIPELFSNSCIEGNAYFARLICDRLDKRELRLLMSEGIVWPFTEDKVYFMGLLSLEILHNNIE